MIPSCLSGALPPKKEVEQSSIDVRWKLLPKGAASIALHARNQLRGLRDLLEPSPLQLRWLQLSQPPSPLVLFLIMLHHCSRSSCSLLSCCSLPSSQFRTRVRRSFMVLRQLVLSKAAFLLILATLARLALLNHGIPVYPSNERVALHLPLRTLS